MLHWTFNLEPQTPFCLLKLELTRGTGFNLLQNENSEIPGLLECLEIQITRWCTNRGTKIKYFYYKKLISFSFFSWFSRQICNSFIIKMGYYEHFLFKCGATFCNKITGISSESNFRVTPWEKIPHQHIITCLVEKFRDIRSVVNNNKGHSNLKFKVRKTFGFCSRCHDLGQIVVRRVKGSEDSNKW